MIGERFLIFISALAAAFPVVVLADIRLGFPKPWPSYYEEALQFDGEILGHGTPVESDGVHRIAFLSADGDLSVAIELLPCEDGACVGLYEGSLQKRNEILASQDGRFRSVSTSEYVVEWRSGELEYLDLIARLPNAVVAWERVTTSPGRDDDEEYLARVRSVLDRQRFEEALDKGNVALGRWDKEIHRYAIGLLEQGRKGEALDVLQHVIRWAPANYEAQLDFAENTGEEKSAQVGALAVWERAESPELVRRAANLLGRPERSFESVPVIEMDLRGLQVVLVPLPPADIRLIEAAGEIYEQKFEVPVRLARLPEEWSWGGEDRFHGQREMERAIHARAGKAVDLTGGSRAHYASELTAAFSDADPLSQYHIRTFLDDAVDRLGQFAAAPYVERLLEMLSSHRSEDLRTMVVGVTAADIYNVGTNYVFSSGRREVGGGVSILSYARMLAESQEEPFESRQRVAERLAKEMVPASLQQLGIPRPTDPADPYSYSSGTERLEQKTLTLSAQTREALDEFRDPQ